MSGAIPKAARELAVQIEGQFGKDVELARHLAEAQGRLARANERLWSGLHPDGLAAVYGEHPSAIEAAVAKARSEAHHAPDLLAAVQQVHWSIYHAVSDYQTARREPPATRRRHRRDDPPIRRRARRGRLDRGERQRRERPQPGLLDSVCQS